MRTITWTYALLLVCASGCSFLDDLDRSIEQKAEQLTKDVTAPASPTPTPTPPPPPAPEPPTPPTAPVEPPPVAEVPEELGTALGTPLVTLGKLDVRGALAEKEVRKIIDRHKNELRFCYAQTLAGDALIVIKLVVSPTGSVQVASVGSSTSGIEKLDMCFAQAARRWSFPAPQGGGIVVITAAFELKRRPNTAG